jgi:O-antigen chain-terminating methyltransferase
VTADAGPGGVDVARLMEEIKERVRQKKASGFYSEEEVRRIAEMELEVTDALPTFRSEIEHHLAALNDGWDTTAEPAITSHRKLTGRMIVGFKRLLRRATRPYITLVLAPQVRFNGTLLQLLNSFVLPVRDTLGGLAKKDEDLALALHEQVAVAHAETTRKLREAGRQIERLEEHLTALRQTVERLKGPAGAPALVPPPVVPATLATLPGEAYLRFEDLHRGDPEDIRERQRAYLGYFPAGPVLDIGCGRGEFLELCREAAIPARGVDVDGAMVARCREAGLDVVRGDALEHLAGLPDNSLGGVFCAQVIEHLTPEAFVALVRLAHAKVRSGGVLLCETPNPMCLAVFASAFYVDLSHIKPIHPQGAAFVLEAAGFRDVELRYLNPCPPEAKLQPLEPLWYMRRYEHAFMAAINDNLSRLNDLLWGAQDYAVIGKKP